MTTKPCAICDKQLKSIHDNSWEHMQPENGGEINLIFSYGSLKFDDCIGVTKFTGVICDDCAEKIVCRLEKSLTISI